MPSPAGTSHPSRASPTKSSSNSRKNSNNVTTSGRAQSDAPSVDAMAKRKDKAKAVLAASNVAVHDTSKSNSNDPTPVERPPSPSDTYVAASADQDSRPTTQQLHLEQYVLRDMLHADALLTQRSAAEATVDALAQGVDLAGSARPEQRREIQLATVYGLVDGDANLPVPRPPIRVIYPSQRKRPGGRRTHALRIARKDMAAQAEQLEELVPVRLDIEWDRIKLRDTFTWNLHDRVISPEVFAAELIEDFKLPLETAGPLAEMVSQTLEEQIQDFYPPVFIDEEALDPHLPYHAYKNDEMRVLIKLNITIGQYTLIDQFEWDINNPLNLPEIFAMQMTRDLSLSGEFMTAIAHCIREQCQLFTKSLYITGHPFDGRPVEDPDLQEALLPSPLPSVFRPAQHAKDYSPYLWELNEAELEREETSLSRDQRRQKRSTNRRGGPALPDLKDRPRTIRTLVMSSVIPGSAESIDDSRLLKRPEVTPGRPTRRAAAKAGAGDDSDLSESSDSGPDSPANATIVMTSGTSRTRGMRGAASAAQAAMKNAVQLGRSMTPEVGSSTPHHHETRISSRRLGTGGREESLDDGSSLIVRLKVGKERLRQFERERRSRARGGSGSLPPSSHNPPPPTTPGRGSMGPPLTPGLPPAAHQHPSPFGGHLTPQGRPPSAENGIYGPPPYATPVGAPPQIGGPPSGVSDFMVPDNYLIPSDLFPQQSYFLPQSHYSLQSYIPYELLPPPGFMEVVVQQQRTARWAWEMGFYGGAYGGQPPPPPTWLSIALGHLQTSYPFDLFEGFMRHALISASTGEPLPTATTTHLLNLQAQGQPLPPDVRYAWLPRIRCLDCPGKLYTPGGGVKGSDGGIGGEDGKGGEETMSCRNFEVHLKNGMHRKRVEERVKGGGTAAPAAGSG
ncbi:MAG: SWI/SNF chromatin-remodeling complex subunit [Caeruleum heppii]|nr:MAG: SWI/SNF chromatin-remodeling complex subunit [Caeruleum heppii]